MEHFSGGIFYAYNYSLNSFVPFDDAVLAASPSIDSQRNLDLEGKDGDPLSGSYSASTTSSDLSSMDTSTSEAPATEGSSPSRATGPSHPIDASTSTFHIPRPRNAFMIFRAEFSGDKINRSVEHDNRHISRIIGYCWNKLSEEEKFVWRRKAEVEKLAHMKKHPNYRFTPTARTKKPLKRKVNRNGQEERHRCQQVADLLLLGKEGEDLADAVKKMDSKESIDDKDGEERPALFQESSRSLPQYRGPSEPYRPSFCTPLLPPSEALARHWFSRSSTPSTVTYEPDLSRQAYAPTTLITGSTQSPYFQISTEKAQQPAIASPPYPQFPTFLSPSYAPNSPQNIAYVQAPSCPPSSEPVMYPMQHLPGPFTNVTQSYTF